MRTGIPQTTRTIPSLNAFLIENLRGPAIKLGCTVVSGHTFSLDVITQRVKHVLLYTNKYAYATKMFSGAGVRKPPQLPANVTVREGAAPSAVGALIFFADSPLDCAKIEFVPNARIMGHVDMVKRVLKGRKFDILNRWETFICVELAS